MKNFKDTEGRDWTIAVTMGSVRRVKDLAGVNLAHITEGDTLQRLASDPEMLCRTIWAMVHPQAESRGVSEDAFFDSMGGDSIEAATVALLEDLPDFFPKSRREVLRRAVDKLTEIEAAAAAMALDRLDGPEMAREIESILSGAASNWPQSQEPTPNPERSGS